VQVLGILTVEARTILISIMKMRPRNDDANGIKYNSIMQQSMANGDNSTWGIHLNFFWRNPAYNGDNG
jgi:hypothetical protein